MRTSSARGLRALIGWSAALLGALLLTVAIPMTTSAFTASITNSANAAVSKRVFTCADTFAGDRRRSSAYFEFAFDEAAGATTARDSSDANNTGTYQGPNVKDGGAPVACPNDPGGAYSLDGNSSRVLTSKSDGPIVSGFTEEIWFKASSGGKLMGYESEQSGDSPNYDKHLYVDSTGKLRYGTDGNGVQTIASDNSVIDGNWHLATATTSPTDGSVLYLDGQLARRDTAMVAGEPFSGYWRVGEGKLAGWDFEPGRRYFTGSLRFAAAYPYVLTAAEVASAWSIGKPGAGPSPSATPVMTVSAVPDQTATATAAPATDSPATPSASASSSAQPVSSSRASGGPATLAPAPSSPQSAQ